MMTLTLTTKCKVSGETVVPGRGPFWETADYMLPSEAEAYALKAAANPDNINVKISTRKKINGRWKFIGYRHFQPAGGAK